jgi:hypothetical protein
VATYVQQILLLLDSLDTRPISTRVLTGRVAGLSSSPCLCRTLFVEQPGGGFTNTTVVEKTAKTPAADSKGKKDGDEPKEKKQKCDVSDKSLKMGIFHIKQSVNVTSALPKQGKLKVSICLNFCAHGKKCNYPQMLCKNSKHYTTWKNILDKD